MQTKLKPAGWMGDARRGASHGRVNVVPEDGGEGLKVRLSRLRIDGGGYDEGGAYWGLGDPVWWARDDGDRLDMFTRAATRDEAKAAILARAPRVTFWR
ncbi:MAG: hypothetical protein EA356_14920 [Geminicoccaceae bacterium]|nr:MAG: hypothetical protein EA356_14920 [Geminicoccaceae bacterium]